MRHLKNAHREGHTDPLTKPVRDFEFVKDSLNLGEGFTLFFNQILYKK